MFLLFFVAWGGLTSQLFLHSLPYVPSLWQREGIFNHSTKRMTTSKSFRNGLEISTQSPTQKEKRNVSPFFVSGGCPPDYMYIPSKFLLSKATERDFATSRPSLS